MHTFDLQPRLSNGLARIEPLQDGDFEALYAIAADPLIWEQHPNKLRFQREFFRVYFAGAVDSRGAFRVFDARSGALVGCSRYYDLQPQRNSVSIGYTFIARSAWGTQLNRALKTLLLDHAFGYLDKVFFEVGVNNLRSRRAMEKLGARHVGEAMVAYHGEPARPNVIYRIDKNEWQTSAARFTG